MAVWQCSACQADFAERPAGESCPKCGATAGYAIRESITDDRGLTDDIKTELVDLIAAIQALPPDKQHQLASLARAAAEGPHVTVAGTRALEVDSAFHGQIAETVTVPAVSGEARSTLAAFVQAAEGYVVEPKAAADAATGTETAHIVVIPATVEGGGQVQTPAITTSGEHDVEVAPEVRSLYDRWMAWAGVNPAYAFAAPLALAIITAAIIRGEPLEKFALLITALTGFVAVVRRPPGAGAPAAPEPPSAAT